MKSKSKKFKKVKKAVKIRKKVFVKKKQPKKLAHLPKFSKGKLRRVKKKKAKKVNKKVFIKKLVKIKRPKIKIKKKKSKKVFVKRLAKKVIKKKKVKAKLVKIKRQKIKKVNKLIKKSKKKIAVKKLKIKKLVRRPAPKRIVREKTEENFSSDSLFKAKIKVIGIGGGGASIVSEIGRSLHKASFVVADTDVRAFRKKAGIKQFLFGQELTHGLGTGLNTELAKAAAESEKERIAKLFEGQDIVMLISCLGGGLGSGATKGFAEALENFQGIILGIFTLPFKFEGKNKQRLAYKALKELRKSLNVSITIPNERIFKVIDENTAITDAFSMVNKNLIESLESLIDLIYSPGIINIDFADLRAILKGKGNIAFLNTAEAQGKDGASKLAEQILQNPLYQNSNFTADKILFNILGGPQLGMFDVDKISRAIAQKNPKAKIIFGISKDGKYKNKIKTTLLMTGQGAATEPVAIKEVKEPEPKIVRAKAEKKSAPVINKKPILKKKKKAVKKVEEKVPVTLPELLPPVFNNVSVGTFESRKLSITEAPEVEKRAIRRSALEIKEAEEIEENKKSKQEEEWEIPAFLRKVKLK